MPQRANQSSRLAVAACLIAGSLGAVLVAFGSWETRVIPSDHPFATLGQRLVASDQGQFVVNGAAFAGTLLMLLTWLGLWRFRDAVSWRVLVFAWALPLLGALPSVSFDLFNYVEQGWAVLQGHNPYVTPMGKAGGFVDFAGPWAGKTVGYPPLALMIQAGLVWLGASSPFWSLMTMKLMGVGGLALAYAAMRMSSRWIPASHSTLMWATFANPAILIHALGDGHNDALASGLAVFGVALAGRLKGLRGLLLGGFLVGLAGAIKQPVLVFLFAVAVLSVAHLPAGFWARWRRLILPGISTGIAGLAGFLLPGFASGWGFGWTTATGLSAYGRSTPLRYFYELASNLSIALGGDKFRSTVPEIVPTVAMVLVILLAVCLFLMWGPQYPVEVTIVAFGFYFLLGRTVQPWYTLWFLLAVVLIRMTRWRALALVGLSTWMLGAMFARPWGPVNWYTQFTWAVVAAATAMAIFVLLSRNGQPSTRGVAADRF